MAKIDIFVSRDCPHCHELKDEIKILKQEGKFNCPVNYIELEQGNNEKLFDDHNINMVPTILVDGEEITVSALKRMCR